LGATLGVVISGVIVDELSWRWIFLVNVPVAAFVLATAPRMVRESRPSGSPRIDYLGALLVTGGLTLIIDGLLQKGSHAWGSSTVVIPMIIGGALLVALLGSQIVQSDPLIPRRFFANRTRVSATAATMFATAGFFSLFFSMTLYLQGVLHYSALKTGLAWGPFGLMLFVGLGVGQKLLPQIGVKNGLTMSYLISAGGLFWLGHIGSHSHYASDILPGMLIMALGQSIGFVGLLNSAPHRLGPADAGLGSAVQSTSQQLGGSLGLAILISIALNHSATKMAHGVAPAVASVDGYSLAIKLGAAVMVAGAVVVALAFEKVDFTAPDKLAVEAAEAEASDVGVTISRDRPRRLRPKSSHERRVERQGRARYRFDRRHRRRDRVAACRRGRARDRFAAATASAAGSLLTRQGPPAGRYPAVAAMVIFALVPYLALSASLQPLAPIIARQLHMSPQAMSLTEGLANAGYAMGTVFAVQFALRLPQRRMLLMYGVLLVVGSVLAASATASGVFIAGHVLQGVCTSLLLIAAFPPLIVAYPASKLRWTAMVVNVCVFCAVALGPVVGGIQASAHAWRPLFWIIAGIALAALVLSVLTFQDAPRVDPRRRWDPLALGWQPAAAWPPSSAPRSCSHTRFLMPSRSCR
jgi:MFS family permease